MPVSFLALHSLAKSIEWPAVKVYKSDKLTSYFSYKSLLLPANARIRFPGAFSLISLIQCSASWKSVSFLVISYTTKAAVASR